MAKELDKRVERSRALLMDALLDLMRSQPYSKISVAQICEHSQVARPTFYLHYRSKDDLFRGYIEVMFLEFYEQTEKHFTQTPKADPIIGEIMFRQWSDNRELAKLMATDEVEGLLLNEFKRYVERIMQRYISVHNLPIQNTPLLPYIVDFIAGASFMVIMRWIKDDFPVDAQRMGQLYANLVQPGLLQIMLNGKV